nr:unnamed protein product [Callosobruchus analis]
MKNKHFAGFDELSVFLLQQIKEHLLDNLVHLINTSITNSCFPAFLKQISLLCILSKILEKFMYGQLYQFMNKHNILSACQHGFQANKSVETASCHYLELIYDQLDVTSLLFDLSKAFDFVDRNILRNKLEAIGIRGVALDWTSAEIPRLSYFVVAQSVIANNLILWGNSTDASKGFIIQNKIFRIMAGIHPLYPCRELFKKLYILTLPSLYIYLTIVDLMKGSEYPQMRNSDVHSHNTRNNRKIYQHYYRLQICQNSVKYKQIGW